MKGSKAFEPENKQELILLALGEVFNSRISDKYAEDYVYKHTMKKLKYFVSVNNEGIKEADEIKDDEWLESAKTEAKKLIRGNALVQYAVDCGVNYSEAVLTVGYTFDYACTETDIDLASTVLFEHFGKKASPLSAFGFENILRSINVSEGNKKWVDALKLLVNRAFNPKYDLDKTLEYIENHQSDFGDEPAVEEQRGNAAWIFACKLWFIQFDIEVIGSSYAEAIRDSVITFIGTTDKQEFAASFVKACDIIKETKQELDELKRVKEMKKRGEIVDD